jgi:hypothetical protein
MAFIPPPAPVVVPPPIHTGGSSGDVPTPYVIAYIAVALLVWVVVAVAAALHESDKPDGEQIFMGVMLGATAAIMWPLTAIAASVWLLVRRLTRPRTDQPKETRR